VSREVHVRRIRIPDRLDEKTRIDTYISDILGLFSRSQVKKRVQKVLLSGREVKLGKSLMPGEVLEIYYTDPPEITLEAEAIELDILYEDANVLVVNKPQGMVVHPGCGNPGRTLVNALLYHCRELEARFPGEHLRPGIVHRLDKDTSGVIITAKNPEALETLAGQFRGGRTRKTYLALVRGRPEPGEGTIDTLIRRHPRDRKRFAPSQRAGKRAVTRYGVLRSFDGFSLLLLRPRTGRTHQLRVHMRHLGCPILGDALYGRRDGLSLMLHAYRLAITLPGESSPRVFKARLPERFKAAIRRGSRRSAEKD
jgi:23S rRNA pseudouridine1911/1915/1917 synthase